MLHNQKNPCLGTKGTGPHQAELSRQVGDNRVSSSSIKGERTKPQASSIGHRRNSLPLATCVRMDYWEFYNMKWLNSSSTVFIFLCSRFVLNIHYVLYSNHIPCIYKIQRNKFLFFSLYKKPRCLYHIYSKKIRMLAQNY